MQGFRRDLVSPVNRAPGGPPVAADASSAAMGRSARPAPSAPKSRPRGQFAGLLGRKRSPAGATAEAGAAAWAAWFRSEPPPLAPKNAAVGPPAAARAADRLLVGTGGAGIPEARIRFGAGALAGAELRLQVQPGRAIELEVLTAVAGSRQTLSLAMDEVRRRLRVKGITLSAERPERRPPLAGAGPNGNRGRGGDRPTGGAR